MGQNYAVVDKYTKRTMYFPFSMIPNTRNVETFSCEYTVEEERRIKAMVRRCFLNQVKIFIFFMFLWIIGDDSNIIFVENIFVIITLGESEVDDNNLHIQYC